MRHVLPRLAALAALAVLCVWPATQASAEPIRDPAAAAAPANDRNVFDKPLLRPPKQRRVTRRPRPTLGERAARLASRYLGVPYSWGGASPRGFDCSGLVMYVYSQLGVSLPHHAASQYTYGRAVPYSRLRPGDIVFFSGLGHVGLYVGKGRFIDAPQSGDVVRSRPLAERLDSYVGARRIVVA